MPAGTAINAKRIGDGAHAHHIDPRNQILMSGSFPIALLRLIEIQRMILNGHADSIETVIWS